MSDLFHPDVPDRFIVETFDVMCNVPQHTYQVLTKRPQRMARFVEAYISGTFGCIPDVPGIGELPRRIWLGTSIENDAYAFRADHLRATPAAVRFLSLEPLLGPLPSLDLTDINWVIVGGESGPGARSMHPSWARDLCDRCIAAGIPFLFKQWGEWAPSGALRVGPNGWIDADESMERVGKKWAGQRARWSRVERVPGMSSEEEWLNTGLMPTVRAGLEAYQALNDLRQVELALFRSEHPERYETRIRARYIRALETQAAYDKVLQEAIVQLTGLLDEPLDGSREANR